MSRRYECGPRNSGCALSDQLEISYSPLGRSIQALLSSFLRTTSAERFIMAEQTEKAFQKQHLFQSAKARGR